MSTENKTVESIPAITIRFAGDSGDGMQLVGTRFTDTSAVFGNDLATLPAFPAAVSYTHLRAHETCADLVCRLLLEKKN